MKNAKAVLSVLAAAAAAAATMLPVVGGFREAGRAEARRRHDSPGEALEFYARKRVPLGGTRVPVERYAVARAALRSMPRYSTALGRLLPPSGRGRDALAASLLAPEIGTWEPLGPGNVGGRTRALVIHPGAPNTIWAAGVAGGVWKTTDGGATWAPLDDLMGNLAVSTLALDPFDSDNLLAGTGEGFFNGDFVSGDGIFRSTDGGTTWTQVSSTAGDFDFRYVNKLAYSPVNAGLVWAATRTGLWHSTDGGANWTRPLNPGLIGGCLDVVVRDDVAAEVVFASCGTFTQAGIYRNETALATPTSFTLVHTEPGMGRTSLALAPSNQDVVYALASSIASGPYSLGLHAVFRSPNGGDTWPAAVRNTSGTFLNTLLLTNPLYAHLDVCYPGYSPAFYNQGWYDNVIGVDPVDPNIVWAGGIDLFRSNDGGANWGIASYWWGTPGSHPSYAHADQHTILFHPGYNGTSNKIMFVGNDGGIFKTTDARAGTASGGVEVCNPANSSVVFTNLNNGYGVTQFYYGTVYPDGQTYFGGTQDNGTVRGDDGGGPDAWQTILGGDGGAVAVDPTNTDVLYGEYTGLSIQKSTDGGSSFGYKTDGISDPGFLFIAPFVMDPTDSQRLWAGGKYMWRTVDAAESWQRASTAFAQSVSAIAVSPTDPNWILAGTTGGRIYRTTKGLTAGASTGWSSVAPSGGYVSSVAFDPASANVAYATYSSFGVPHVWKSTNGGATWYAVDAVIPGAEIPDIPVHSVVVDPTDTSRVYVGTDLGVFVSTNGGGSWAQENTGFANVVTEQLVVNGANVYAFTHGRGAWRVSLRNGTTVVLGVSQPGSTVLEAPAAQAVVEVELATSDLAPTAGPVTVQYATADGTATAGADYTSTSGVLTFPGGSPHGATLTIGVPILDDATADGGETFDVTLSSPGGGAFLGASRHTVTLEDTASVQFRQPVYKIGEAATRVVVAVTRTEDKTQAVTVDYDVSSGTATAAQDFAATTGTVTFAPNATTATFAVTLLPDTVYEGEEHVLLRLYGPSAGAVLGTQRTAVVAVADNDASASVQFAASKVTASEGAGTASVLVRRTGVTTSTATADYAITDGTATSPADYASATTGTLTFSPGVVTQTLSVNLVADAVAEPNETVSFALQNPGPGTKLGALRSSILTILNDDQGLQFSLPSYTFSEAAAKAVLTVKRSGGTAGSVTVDYSVGGGTATAGSDYDGGATSGSLSFTPGSLVRTLAVPLVNDTDSEGEETFGVTLQSVNGATILGANPATVRIADNEPTVQFSAPKYGASEAAAKATITVRRSGGTVGTANVDYAVTAGTATFGEDYAGATSGSLSFAPGIATRTFSVTLTPDARDEAHETLNLSLVQVDLPLGTPNTAVLTVTDNDVAGRVQLGAPAFSADESTGQATITLVRASGTAEGATVQWTLTPGPLNPTDAGDYPAATGTVVFAAGETKKTFTIPITDDGFGEPNESAVLTLTPGPLPGGYGVTIGAVRSAVLWIID